ncbi:MAG: NADH-quinone oxidoreductase subunit C, partial [Pontixanthobacter sp.]
MTVLHYAPKFADNTGVADTLSAAFGDALLNVTEQHGELFFTVRRDSIEDVLRILRDDHQYQQLMEIAGVDYPGRTERFE